MPTPTDPESRPTPQPSKWQKPQYNANLLRYAPTGTFFARIRISGKLIWRSLKTRAITVAKLKLADLEREERARREITQTTDDARATFRALLDGFFADLDSKSSPKAEDAPVLA